MKNKRYMTVSDLQNLLDDMIRTGETTKDSPVLWLNDESGRYGKFIKSEDMDKFDSGVVPFNDSMRLEYLDYTIEDKSKKIKQCEGDSRMKDYVKELKRWYKESMKEKEELLDYMNRKAIVLGGISK